MRISLQSLLLLALLPAPGFATTFDQEIGSLLVSDDGRLALVEAEIIKVPAVRSGERELHTAIDYSK